MSLAESSKAEIVEFRYNDIPQWACKVNQNEGNNCEDFFGDTHNFQFTVKQIRVRMLMKITDDPQYLMTSFKSKLRSQIKKSMKEGCEAIVGGRELIDQFYQVFSVNMRDLGSPVHSKQLFAKIFEFLPDESRIFLIRKGAKPVAGSVTIGFRDVLSNPWASSLREYSHMNPNMLLYWKMIEYACQNGFAYFDFGRSTPNEGTFKFKEQWGAVPHKLSWIYTSPGNEAHLSKGYDRSKYQRVIEYWKRLPVPLTILVGPILRKHIPL
jgi:FemAB-related protein (PEP-CTERM system-associated)